MASIKTKMHSFSIGDVEDPMLYAGQPIWEWQQTEFGQWCMQHSVSEIVFYCNTDLTSLGYRIDIVGELEEQDHTYFMLKWAAVKR